jgi:hypothetical protein
MIACSYSFLGHLLFFLWLKKQWNAAASAEWRHFQEKPKKTKKILDFRKKILSVCTIFEHEENLGNFYVFPLPMDSISDRKEVCAMATSWDTSAVDTVRQ